MFTVTNIRVFITGTVLTLLFAGPSLAQPITVTGDTIAGGLPPVVTNPTWNAGTFLLIGDDTPGSLTINAGGTVTNTEGHIGYNPGSSGTATVAGGYWLNSNFLVVGDGGLGSLIINAGFVSNTFGTIGEEVGSTGFVEMNAGTWDNDNYLRIGDKGTGTLTISGGGVVSNTSGTIGREAGSSGTVNVETGSIWTNSGQLLIGAGGVGGLNLFGTGVVTASTTTLGSSSGGSGTLNLAGTLITGQVSKGPGSGAVAFYGGTLRLTGDQADLFAGFETGDVTLAAGGGIIDTQGFDVATSAAISGTGGLTKQGSGSLTLTGMSTCTGATTVNNGALNLNGGTLSTSQLSEGSGSGTVTFDAGTLRLTGDQANLFAGFESGDVTLAAGGGTIDTQGFNVATSAAISGTGALTKLGSGMLTLSGANTYAGGITIRDGTAEVTGSITHTSGNYTTVGAMAGDNATLNISGTGAVTNSRGSIGSAAGSSGTVNVNGGTWANGQLHVGRSGTGTLNISGNGAVSSSVSSIGTQSGSTGTANVSGGTWTTTSYLYVGHSGTGTLNISGNGAVSSVYAQIGRDSGSSTVNVSGGTFNVSIRMDVGVFGEGTLNISGNGAVSAPEITMFNSGAINLNGGTLTTGQIIENSGGVGTVTFNGGTLRLSANQSNIFSGFETGDITLAGGGGTIDTQAFSVGASNALSGEGALTKVGSGTLTLSGTSTYSGPTHIEEGALVLNGSLTQSEVTISSGARLAGAGTFGALVALEDGSSLAPGNSPGTMTFESGLTLSGGTPIDFELGTMSDLLLITGGTLTGPDSGIITLNLFDSGGFAPGNYTLFDFTGADLSGFDLSDFTFGQTISGYDYELDFAGSTLQLTAVPEPTAALFLALVAFAATFQRRRRMSR